MPVDMEIWLSFNNNAELFQLPVNPSEIKLGNGAKNESITVQRLGETTIIQDPTLETIDFEGFFPATPGPYLCLKNQSELMQPYEYVQLIKKWKDSGFPIRFRISDTHINTPVSIEAFDYYEQGGDVGTVYFSLSLKEYKFIKVRQIETTSPELGLPTVTVDNKGQRPNESQKPTNYTVQKGDNLWAIAKKHGTTYQALAEKNGITAPYTIQPNQVIKL